MNKQIDLSKLSATELEAELKRRQQEAEKAERAKKLAFLKDKDDFLFATVSKFQSVRNELKDLKHVTISEINKLYNRMFEINGKEPKEQKSISLKSECGNYKVTAVRQEKFEFTDEAIVHITAIKEFLKSKFEQRNKGLYELLDSILMKNGKGDYDPKLLAKAKRKVQQLGYDELTKHFDKLQDCLTVSGTALYCHAFKRDDNGKWQNIVVNFSSL